MDRDWALGMSSAALERADAADAFVLPSRAAALELCRAALETEAGPVLITGQAGIGKTWLWRRLAMRLEGARQFLSVDLTPAIDPTLLFRVIGYRLRLAEPNRVADLRLILADHLKEQAADGWRWVLVIDEAHNLSDAVLEEVRILSNRLGRPDGFCGLILAGQTRLARRFATQPLVGFETRLAARIHLRPIDADEARDLLLRRWPERGWEAADIERLHRDAAGNPARLLRLACRQPQAAKPARVSVKSPIASDATPAPTAATKARTSMPGPSPLLGPAKPPIHEEDGLIEVGWEEAPDESPALAERPAPAMDLETASPARQAAAAEPSEEAINDHYAALQAWNEWARNQGKEPTAAATEPLTPEFAAAEEEIKADTPTPDASHTHIWAEGPDSFAPYSQLFSRAKQSKDKD